MSLSIQKRRQGTGKEKYRLILHKHGHPPFSATFTSHEAVLAWLDENEKKYLANPEKFLKYHRAFVRAMQRQCIKEHKGMIRPKLRSTEEEL